MDVAAGEGDSQRDLALLDAATGRTRRDERALEEARKELGIEARLVTPESYYQQFLPELHGPVPG